MRYKSTVHLLVVEDDPRLGRLLVRLFSNDRHVVDLATAGQEALELLEANAEFDAVILDIGLPGIDGFEVARRIRATGSRIPILMLTARDGLSDRVTGLDAGADDYVVKPFAYEELAARVRAVHRRVDGATPDAGPQLQVGPIVLDETRRSVTVAGRAVDLTLREFGRRIWETRGSPCQPSRNPAGSDRTSRASGSSDRSAGQVDHSTRRRATPRDRERTPLSARDDGAR